MTLYVLTGGPCTGKTSVLNELKNRGFVTIDEIARRLLEERSQKPQTREEWLIFEKTIYDTQYLQEETAKQRYGDIPIILDRSIIDVHAYTNYYLQTIPESLRTIDLHARYDAIFLLDRLPLEIDSTRLEKDEVEAERIHKAIRSTYRSYGYLMNTVPVSTVKQRADEIEQWIKTMEAEKHGRVLYEL